MRQVTQRPSDPAYYIEDCRISEVQGTPNQCSVLAAMKRDTGRPPIYKKAYDLYYSECHVLDRYEIKKEDAVLKQTHVHSTLLGLWLSRGL